MYVHSVEMINYKSIGETDAIVILEPDITAIIGMNESGKSNVLEGLSRVDFLEKNKQTFAQKNSNRNSYESKIRFKIVLQPSPSDVEIGETIIEISEDSYFMTGGICDYYKENIAGIFKSIAESLNAIGQNPFGLKDKERQTYNEYRKIWKNVQERIDIPALSAGIKFLEKYRGKLAGDCKPVFDELLNNVKEKWQDLLNLFPAFVYHKADKRLNLTYKASDIETELKNSTGAGSTLLKELVQLIGISNDEFVQAAKPGTSSIQISSRDKIKREIDDKINSGFQELYKTEKVCLDIQFDNGEIIFTVRSDDGETLLLSERSNGLRWFLDLYIDVTAHNLNGRNIIYLLDEPGVSLHINAQKELLRLFRTLADNDNQVVYSTHLPSMLNLQDEGFHKIRAIVKDEQGNTHIYKTPYDSRISPNSQHDTIAPVITALGMNLCDEIGPAYNKRNIVTEGISDYIFLFTMVKYLGIDSSKIAIIPSLGVTNSINLCMILHGWGCDYIALFDFDKEGVEKGGEHLRKEMDFEEGRQYIYVRRTTADDISNKEYSKKAYRIEDVFGKKELDEFSKSNGISGAGKVLIAKLICDEIEKGTVKPSDECIERFRELFSRLIPGLY